MADKPTDPDIPAELEFAGRKFFWDEEVRQTRPPIGVSRPSNWYTDVLGNDFGVGDIVLYNLEIAERYDEAPVISRTSEGIVRSLHRYQTSSCQSEYKTFIAKVNFGDKLPRVVPSRLLEALTCEAIDFDQKAVEKVRGLLKKIEFRTAPDTIRDILEDQIAAAIYCGYRITHAVADTHIKPLRDTSLAIAQKLGQGAIPRERLHLWLKKRFDEGTKHQLKFNDDTIRGMMPYLLGEEKVSWKVAGVG